MTQRKEENKEPGKCFDYNLVIIWQQEQQKQQQTFT